MKRFFNKTAKRRRKANLRKFSKMRKQISKRIGGVIGVSAVLENRDISSTDFEINKKEVV